METTIQETPERGSTMHVQPKWYDAHLDVYRETAFVSSREQYEELYRRSLEEPDIFWADQARRYLSWDKEWNFVQNHDLDEGKVEWFGGGILNASYNCLDRHLEKIGDKTAYYWEGDDPAKSRAVSYRELYERVNRAAAFLKSKGVQKGDRVILYMPMIVELPVAMLACARIGAIHSVVFAGFSADSLASRINDCQAKLVITSDGVFRAGKAIMLKKNVDDALKHCQGVDTVVVFNCCNLDVDITPGRDIWWHEAMSDPDLADYVQPEPMDAEDPLFILYTSGSTGKPKGVVHTHGGYLLYAAMTTRLVFDLKDDEVFWCTADIGWVTGTFLRRVRPPDQRTYIRPVRRRALLSRLRPLLGSGGKIQGEQILHRSHGGPRHRQGRPGPGEEPRHILAQTPGFGGRAHQPRSLALVLSQRGARTGARLWTPGGRPKPAGT